MGEKVKDLIVLIVLKVSRSRLSFSFFCASLIARPAATIAGKLPPTHEPQASQNRRVDRDSDS